MKKAHINENLLDVKWEGPHQKWATSFVKKNFWRVSRIMDFDDAVQECAFKFCQCRLKYQFVSPRNFSSLFHLSVENHFHRLSEKNSHMASIFHEESEEEFKKSLASLHDFQDGPLLCGIRDLSKEGAQVMRLILESPAETIAPLVSMANKTHKKINQFLANLIGADPSKVDIATEIHTLLSS